MALNNFSKFKFMMYITGIYMNMINICATTEANDQETNPADIKWKSFWGDPITNYLQISSGEQLAKVMEVVHATQAATLMKKPFNSIDQRIFMYYSYKEWLSVHAKSVSWDSFLEFVATMPIKTDLNSIDCVDFARAVIAELIINLKKLGLNAEPHLHIISFCLISKYSMDNFTKNEYPDRHTCEQGHVAAAIHIQVDEAKGIVVIDPYKLNNKVHYVMDHMDKEIPPHTGVINYMDLQLRDNKYLVYAEVGNDWHRRYYVFYVNRPYLDEGTDYTLRLNRISSDVAACVYDENGRETAEFIFAMISKKFQIKIGYIPITFNVNEFTCEEKTADDGHTNKIVCQRHNVKGDEQHMCGICNRKLEWEQCTTDHSAKVAEDLTAAAKLIWPNDPNPNQRIIRLMYEARKIANDEEFITAFGRIKMHYLTKTILKDTTTTSYANFVKKFSFDK